MHGIDWRRGEKTDGCSVISGSRGFFNEGL
jgi:hypothetical protein